MEITRLRTADTMNALSDVARHESIPKRRLSKLPVSYCRFGAVVAVFDFALIVAIGAASSAAYHFLAFEEVVHLESFSALAVASALLFCLLLQSQRLYRSSFILRPVQGVRTILGNWALAFCILLVVGFLAKVTWHVSRGATVLFFTAGVVALPLSRVAAKHTLKFLIANNYLAGRSRVVLLGDEHQLSSRGMLMNLGRHGYSVVNEISLRLNARDSLQNVREIEASIAKLKDFTRTNPVDEIFLAFDSAESRNIDVIVERLRSVPMPVRLLLDQRLGAMLSRPISDLGAAKAIKVQSGPLSEAQQVSKRMLDFVVASAGLFVLAPFFVLIAIAIKLDTAGPVLFRQRRAGFNGRIFRIYKFRSMTVLDDGGAIKQATRDDKRVTRVGRVLRKTSLDELPQLLNVLQGDMSLVGPRPHALSHDNEYDKLIATYALRHHMKPGITGWAQVNGYRGETRELAMMEARVTHDLWYIKNWSLMLDLRALIMTVVQVLRPKNVY